MNDYAKAIAHLFHQFQATPITQWNQLTDQIEVMRSDIEMNIDAWMELDEQLDELVQHLVLNDDQSIASEHLDGTDGSDELNENVLSGIASMPAHTDESPWQPTVAEDPIALSIRKAMGFYDLWLFDEARSLFRQVLRYEPDNLLAALFYAASETVQGHAQRALPYIQQIRQSGDKRYQMAAEEIAAIGAFVEGDVQTAVDCLLEVVKQMPDYGDTWFNLGLCYTKLGDWTAAAGALTQALDLDADDTGARELLIDVCIQLQEYDVGMAQTVQGLQSRPLHSGLLQRKAKILAAQQDFTTAEQVYRDAIAQDPHNLFLYGEYADLCLVQGRAKQAAAVLKKGLTISSQHKPYLLRLAAVQLINGIPDDAMRILGTMSDNRETRPLMTLCRAQLQWQAGKRGEATALTEGLLQASDPNIRNLARYYYSRLLWQSDRHDEAMRALAEVEPK